MSAAFAASRNSRDSPFEATSPGDLAEDLVEGGHDPHGGLGLGAPAAGGRGDLAVLQLGDGGVAALEQAEDDLGGVELAELGGLGELEHGALPAGEGQEPVLVRLELAVAGPLLGDVHAAVGDPLPEVLELVDLPDGVHEEALRGELDGGAGLLVGLLVHQGERAFAGEDDGMEDVRDLLGHAGPEVVWLEQPAVDEGPAHAAGRVVAEGVLDVVAGGVADADQHLAEAVGRILAAGAVDLAVLEDDGALSAGGVEPQGAGPAGLAEEGDEVREREAGGIADEDDPRALAPSALGGLRGGQR